MALAQRMQSLKQRHHEIDALIRQEEARVSPNEIYLHSLKRQKLDIKDELATLLQSAA